MKKETNNKSNIILGIILFIIIIICAIYVDNSKQNTSRLYENLNIDKTKLNIFYLNVGQADSTLITMGEDVMLIDGGNDSDGELIYQFLKAQGIDEIDYLIETHSDDDHSGGIETIVQNLKVSNVYMPQSAISKSEIKDDISINIFSDLEQTYTLDKATWKVLSVNNSEDVKENEDNDTSIVIQLNYENNKFLFMGDATSKVEKQLLNNNKLEKVDALKVGHHGSNTSSSQDFLNAVLPTYSIISVNNSEYSKHPAEGTIERLESINSKIYRTDKNGTLWVTSDGTEIQLQELNVDVNGKKIGLLENRKYSLIFLCSSNYKTLPSLSTTL